MITLKDYAEKHNVSYEAVRQQVARYAEREEDGFKLSDHISKVDRTQYLDDEAVAFLDQKRAKNPVVIMESSKDEEIERLKSDLDMLRVRIDGLQTKLIAAQDESKHLAADNYKLEMEKQQYLQDRKAMEQIKRQHDEEVAALRRQASEAYRAQKEAEDRADKMQKSGLFARIFKNW